MDVMASNQPPASLPERFTITPTERDMCQGERRQAHMCALALAVKRRLRRVGRYGAGVTHTYASVYDARTGDFAEQYDHDGAAFVSAFDRIGKRAKRRSVTFTRVEAR